MKLMLKGLVFLLLFPLQAFSEPGPYFRFIENKKQWPSAIDFASKVPGGTMSVSAGRFTYTLLDFQKLEELHEQGHHGFQEVKESSEPEQMINGYSLSVDFVDANVNAKSFPFGKLDAYYNFFTGSDSSHWASHANAFEGMTYQSLYAGVDMKIYSQGSNLKYDFVVAPGADPSMIVIRYSGAEQIYLDRGDLFVKTSLGDLIEKKPVTYQIINGERVLVPSEFLLCDNELSFSFPKGYDECYELVIDPLLIFSTYSGSKADNWGSTATPGENGSLYSAGVTNQYVFIQGRGEVFSGTFPATTGAFQTSYGGIYDVGILKYDSTGKNLLYASYLGGSNNESPHSLVMNSANELIMLGTTGSANFPTTLGAFARNFKGGIPVNQNNAIPVEYSTGSDIFLARISTNGGNLLASTYLGGTRNDGLNPTTSELVVNYGDEMRGDIITDDIGNIYVSTVTSSLDFPVKNGFDVTYNGGASDGLLLKIDPSLSTILWSGFIGGIGADASYTIKFDKLNNLFVAGGTSSQNFPVTGGVYQNLYGGGVDGWIANIANDGTSILSSTYTGTQNFNQIYFIDLNERDEVYVYGQTVGTFPVTSGVYSNPGSGQFLQKFDHQLVELKLSTVFGSGIGLPNISPTAFLVNDCNNIYMTGWGGAINHFKSWNTYTTGMPVTSDAFQKTTNGSDFYFIVLTDDAKEFLYGTYMGGNSSRTHVDGGTSRFDKKGVVYHAVCSGCRSGNSTGNPTSDFPTTGNAWSRTNNSLNCNNAAFKFDLSSLRARIQTNSVKLNLPGLNKVCLPDPIVFQNRSTGGETYYWDLGDGTKTIVPDTSAIVHQYKNTGQYVVKLKAVDAGTCIGKDSTSTIVNVYKPLGVAGPGGAYCTGSSFQLTASEGVSYNWIGLKSDFKANIQNPIVTPAEETNYEITITDFQGCVVKDTVNVKVVPGIDLSYELTRRFNCYSRPELEVINFSDDKEETFWDFGDGTTSDLRSVTHTYQKDSLYRVKLVGKKDFCVYTKEENIPVFTFFIPNVITPDQSIGKNDTFQVLYGDRTPQEMQLNMSLIIYDRWGGKVYENQNYKNDWSGGDLSAGVYYYETTAAGEATCKGWVQIIR